MKHCRYLLLLLALLVSAGLRAQYNPNNPDEPGTKPWLLTLKSIPADAGSFNISKQTSHAAGEQIGLKANDNGNYKFADWEDEEGNIIATTAQYNYTMPAKHVTLVARYTYSPNNPNEPDSPTQHQYSRIYLETSPADGGSFNVSSGNSYEVGTIVTLHAYNNANFKFEKWTEDGQTISTDNELEYTVKATDSHLTAHFNYSPGNPGEPSEASISHHLYLKANPSEGGYFNMSHIVAAITSSETGRRMGRLCPRRPRLFISCLTKTPLLLPTTTISTHQTIPTNQGSHRQSVIISMVCARMSWQAKPSTILSIWKTQDRQQAFPLT